MAQSEFTKNVRRKLWIYRILDALCLISPILIYVGIAMSQNGIAAQKVAVVTCVAIAIILTCANIIFQKHLRCPIWIVIIGLYIAVRDYLLPLIMILAVTSLMDDFLFTPLIQHYKSKLDASKTMDERQEENQ